MRKFLLIPLLIFAFTGAFAQQPPNDGEIPGEVSHAFGQRISYIFEHLDLSQVQTGILSETGFSTIDLEDHKGNIIGDEEVSLPGWRSLYSSMETGQVNGNVTMRPIELVNTDIDSYAGDDVTEIVVQHFHYNRFKDDALSSNLVQVQNEQIYDVAGRPASPYRQEVLFAAAPVRSFFTGTSVKFIFRPELFFTNTGKTLSQIYFDAGTGSGFQPVSWNSIQNITYSSTGEKTIRYKFEYADGTNVLARSKIFLNPSPAPLGNLLLSHHNFPLSGFPAPQAYQGIVGGGKVTVIYHHSNTTKQLRKPFIVAEGFDPSNVFADLPNIDYEDFVRNVSNRTDLKYRLDSAGYDIVFLDYDNGTDYIQRNAYLLENVIEWVNQQKALNGSTEQNVVLGVSMGGLVARYALRHMEQRGVAHQTGLFISMDAPHQGANVPLGIQMLVKHLNNINVSFGGHWQLKVYNPARVNPELAQAYNLLNSPAARQMLRHQVDVDYNFGATNYYNTSADHDAFMNEYRGMGYPTQCRNIALSNGSECGRSQALSPYALLFKVDGSEEILDIDPFAAFAWGTVLGTGLFNFPALGLIALGFSGKYDMKPEFIANALPSQQALQIYKGKVRIEKRTKILFLIPVNVTVTNKSLNSTSSMLALDSAPGGIYELETLLPNIDLSIMPGNPTLYLEEFSFVATTSALDIGGGNVTLAPSDLLADYSGATPPSAPKDSPFAAFVTAGSVNEVHTQFTLRNSEYIWSEMVGQPINYNCLTFCDASGTMISGPEVVACNKTFTFSAVPGATYTWTYSSNLQLVSGGAGNSITVTNTGNPGDAFIELSVSSPCGSFTVRKVVQSGLSGPDEIGGDWDPSNPVIKAFIHPVPTATSYEWFLNGNPHSQTGTFVSIRPPLPIYCGKLYEVSVRAVTPCGKTARTYRQFYGPCGNMFVVYPNPAGNTFSVGLRENSTAALNIGAQEADKKLIMQLFDTNFRLCEAVETILGQEVSFDTSDLPAGVYYLRIQGETINEQQQVIIQH